MKSLRALLPDAASVLKLSSRALAGFVLESMNADPGVKRYHPKTICNDVGGDFGGTTSTRVVLAVVAALGLMEREGYIGKDYADAVDANWFVLTDKGRAVTKHEIMADPKMILTSNQPLVFISCGQAGKEEIALGNAIAKAIDEGTDYTAYFAQQVHSLVGLNESILDACSNAVAFIIVMHPRGNVELLNDQHLTRGSVWIEQEVAIAAYRQRTGDDLPVMAYIHKDVAREGIRTLLHMNEITFADNGGVIEDVRARIASGDFVREIEMAQPAQRAVASALPTEPKPLLRATAAYLTYEDARKFGVQSSMYQIKVAYENVGQGVMESAVISTTQPAISNPTEIGPVPKAERLYFISLPWTIGQPTDSVPNEIRIDYRGGGWHGACILSMKPGSNPPQWELVNAKQQAPERDDKH